MTTFLLRIYQAILYWEASLFRARYSGPMIAITGSVGKTSTKEAIGSLVRKAYGPSCYVTPKSLNTELGVPLTLLGFTAAPSSVWQWLITPFQGLVTAFFGTTPQCMVVEVGSDHPGDIAYLSRLVRPTHAIITNISESHSQFLGSLEHIRQEKLSLLQFLSLDGYALLNGDDPNQREAVLQPTQHKIMIRLHTRSDYFMSGIKVTLEGTEGILHHANRTQRVKIQRYGEHHLYSVLFAAAVADSLGISTSVQLQAFKELKSLPGRGMLLAGKAQSLILDESYNAQPAAMEASLHLLADLPAKKKIAILGDMRELKEPERVHQQIGRLAHEVADYIIAVGPQSKAYKADAWFRTAEEAIPKAMEQLGPGVLLLVKGSQNTIRLERLVKALMAHPDQAKQLLVRQGAEWAKKP